MSVLTPYFDMCIENDASLAEKPSEYREQFMYAPSIRDSRAELAITSYLRCVKPKVLALSCVSSSMPFMCRIIKICKTESPETTVICWWPHFDEVQNYSNINTLAPEKSIIEYWIEKQVAKCLQYSHPYHPDTKIDTNELPDITVAWDGDYIFAELAKILTSNGKSLAKQNHSKRYYEQQVLLLIMMENYTWLQQVVNVSHTNWRHLYTNIFHQDQNSMFLKTKMVMLKQLRIYGHEDDAHITVHFVLNLCMFNENLVSPLLIVLHPNLFIVYLIL